MPEKPRDQQHSNMGNVRSLCGREKDILEQADSQEQQDSLDLEEQEWSEEREAWRNDPELLALQRLIARDPQLFVLNNLMMCVQFFENYEEEMSKVRESLVSKKEGEINSRLSSQKHALLPDVLQEVVSKNVGFTSMRQTPRPTVEPLLPIRIYVVHDNVEVTEQNYPPQYSTVNDAVIYNMLLKPSDKRGYVRLRRLEVTPSIKETRKKLEEFDEDEEETDELSSIAEDESPYSDSSIYGPGSSGQRDSQSNAEAKKSVEESIMANRRKQQVLRVKTTGSSPASSTSSGYRSGNYTIDSDSESSGYTSVDKKKDETCVSDSEIPNRCFKKITYTREGKVYDFREERKLRKSSNSKQRRIKQALKRYNYDVWYVNSEEFMKHFVGQFNDCRVAEALGFDSESIDDARPEGSVIYCDKVAVFENLRHRHSTKIEPYEVIPSIWSPWPECAQEWFRRLRGEWPGDEVVDKVKEFGCHIVPCCSNFPNPKENDPHKDLEWQLTFPAVERYLETCMSSSQLRVYLISLMLHKTFLRPVFDSAFGLTTAHIRNKLFWMIEDSDKVSKWPESRTGECLLKLLNSLYHAIGQQHEPILPDYFVRERNLFECVPEEYLLHAQKQLKRIIENPIMYVFHAMENIRYNSKFFPRLNYEGLFRILTMDFLALVNPALDRSLQKPNSSKNYIEDNYKAGSLWETAKNKNDYGRRNVNSKNLINPRKAMDSIIEIPIVCAELDKPRISALMNFFSDHFVRVADRYHRYECHQQKTMYLNQAERLTILLHEDPIFREEAKVHLRKIHELREKVINSVQNEPPQTPRRNPDMPTFSFPLNDRFTTKESLETNNDGAGPSTSKGSDPLVKQKPPAETTYI